MSVWVRVYLNNTGMCYIEQGKGFSATCGKFLSCRFFSSGFSLFMKKFPLCVRIILVSVFFQSMTNLFFFYEKSYSTFIRVEPILHKAGWFGGLVLNSSKFILVFTWNLTIQAKLSLSIPFPSSSSVFWHLFSHHFRKVF